MVQRNTQPRRRASGKLATTTYVGEVIDYIDDNKPPISTGQEDGGWGRRGPGPRFCRVQQVGGVAGSDVADCSFTYDLYELDNVTKINVGQSAVTPKGPPRDPKVTYTAATYGMYSLDYNDSWILFLVDEAPSTEDCAA